VDRHVANGRADKIAILWEGEPGEVRRLTFRELHAEVQRFANALKGLGIKKGDRVAVVHGDDAGAGHCAAGVRSDWRGAFGNFWAGLRPTRLWIG
jgi:acyl-coenzyme A synthetase/AMP-(fatty) acid ligase